MDDGVRFAEINGRLRSLEEKVEDLIELIHGGPSVTRSDSLRGRLHTLETANAAAAAAQAALDAVRSLQVRRLGRAEKFAAILFGFVIAASTLTTTIVVLIQQASN